MWDEQKNYTNEFITCQTFYDIICSCDGLILYLEAPRRDFSDATITGHLLGSDQNEQLFAFFRISYAGAFKESRSRKDGVWN